MAASRQRAREMIEAGFVLVDRLPATRPAMQVDPSKSIRLTQEDHQWVGRGALKLLSVLPSFDIDPKGKVCADLGSSTGGFTEVLLHQGARKVFAIDVGKGLLHWRLRTDDRVVVMEGVNARHLQTLEEPVELITGDLSFISLGLILPTVHRLLAPLGQAVLLVKPQFEVGRKSVSSGGKVTDDSAREAAIEAVKDIARKTGFEVLGSADSGVAGARAKNVEHFLWLKAR